MTLILMMILMRIKIVPRISRMKPQVTDPTDVKVCEKEMEYQVREYFKKEKHKNIHMNDFHCNKSYTVRHFLYVFTFLLKCVTNPL